MFETTTVATQIDAGGVYTMLSSISTSIDAYIGVRFVENLTLTGTANLVGVGNALNNALIRDSRNNTLNCGLGNDVLIGGLGASNIDQINGFSVVDDTIRLDDAIFVGSQPILWRRTPLLQI